MGVAYAPFSSHRQVLVQEGRTAHATTEEAMSRAKRIVQMYRDVAEGMLAVPVVGG